ncbi:uncharacterized protein ACLA_008280 [Aspergillus clavatus NRRL 1]|uniref:Uncharacterized protein n=1 Tax=Aspergillus clavatus (strain ATCC 1007 / CBS 513.65 / DSM 816 / NCTC 3887 / NRRL 1 / QM 1276 / 107) TaxID=344612 RepID=A1CDZ1_ASPCL|nr:uncharacterized protein ACLA_008280 [Aspergillus clavatus NRRL 1]EAW12068.1 hypothetical protein ACLA_008280 [Aspergillus clavatus NRRL 1]
MTFPYPLLGPDCYGLGVPKPRRESNPRHLDPAHVEAVFQKIRLHQDETNKESSSRAHIGWRQRFSRRFSRG